MLKQFICHAAWLEKRQQLDYRGYTPSHIYLVDSSLPKKKSDHFRSCMLKIPSLSTLRASGCRTLHKIAPRVTCSSQPHTILSVDEATTQKLAAKFAEHLVPGDTYLLTGPVGAGKSVFRYSAHDTGTPARKVTLDSQTEPCGTTAVEPSSGLHTKTTPYPCPHQHISYRISTTNLKVSSKGRALQAGPISYCFVDDAQEMCLRLVCGSF